MSQAPRSELSPFAIWLRVMGLGAVLVFLALAGTRILPADWRMAWIGVCAGTWLIGGNVYFHYLRGPPTRSEWLRLAVGLVMLIAGVYVIVTDPR